MRLHVPLGQQCATVLTLDVVISAIRFVLLEQLGGHGLRANFTSYWSSWTLVCLVLDQLLHGERSVTVLALAVLQVNVFDDNVRKQEDANKDVKYTGSNEASLRAGLTHAIRSVGATSKVFGFSKVVNVEAKRAHRHHRSGEIEETKTVRNSFRSEGKEVQENSDDAKSHSGIT